MQHLENKQQHLSLWRNGNYLLLQSGQLVSFVGNQQQFVALPLLVLALTGSAAQAGFVLGIGAVASLAIGPIAGVLVDRWNRKKTMIWCDLGRTLATLWIPLAIWSQAFILPQIYLAVLIASVLGTIFNAASVAALPHVVEEEQLPHALAQSQASFTLIRLFGSLLGGALYSLGRVFPFLVNAVSFAISACSLGLIRGDFQRERAEKHQAMGAAIVEGFGWLWKQPILRFLTLVNGADNLRYGAGYLVIVVLAQLLHASASEIGLIFTAAAVGSLLGNIASTRIRRRFRFGHIAVCMLWLEALMFPLYVVAPNILFMCLIAAAEEFVGPIYTVSLDSYRLLITPDALRGRISSTVQLIMQGTQSLGALLSGILIQQFGAQWSAWLLTLWLLVLAVMTTLNRQVRSASIPVRSTNQPDTAE